MSSDDSLHTSANRTRAQLHSVISAMQIQCANSLTLLEQPICDLNSMAVVCEAFLPTLVQFGPIVESLEVWRNHPAAELASSMPLGHWEGNS